MKAREVHITDKREGHKQNLKAGKVPNQTRKGMATHLSSGHHFIDKPLNGVLFERPPHEPKSKCAVEMVIDRPSLSLKLGVSFNSVLLYQFVLLRNGLD